MDAPKGVRKMLRRRETDRLRNVGQLALASREHRLGGAYANVRENLLKARVGLAQPSL
jgi:hypothetical protein